MMPHHQKGTALIVGGVATTLAVSMYIRSRINASRRRPAMRTRASSIGASELMVSDKGVLPHDNLAPATGNYDAIINVLAVFEGEVDLAALRETIQLKLVPYERFHCVPVLVPTGGCNSEDGKGTSNTVVWVPPGPVIVDQHISVHENLCVDDSTFEDTLHQRVDDTINTALTSRGEGRPWWELHVYYPNSSVDSNSLNNDASKSTSSTSALLIRVHHAIGDGLSLIQALVECLSTSASGTSPLGPRDFITPRAHSAQNVSARSNRAWMSGVNKLSFAWGVLCHMKSLATITNSKDTVCPFQDDARSMSSWCGPNAVHNKRHVVYFPTVQVSDIKKIQQHASSATGLHVTVNDVLFSLVSGVIRRFCARTDDRFAGVSPSDISIRALTAVSFPEEVCATTKYKTLLRNMWTFVLNPMPVAAGTPLERLVASAHSWDQLKRGGSAVAAGLLLGKIASNLLPLNARRGVNGELGEAVSVIFTNVPGPTCHDCYTLWKPETPGVPSVPGVRIKSVHSMYVNLPQHVCFFSMSGEVHGTCTMATSSDPDVVREEFKKAFTAELEALLAL